MIDPGWDSDQNWTTLVAAIETLAPNLSSVRSITATHSHPDHVGMAGRLQEASGAPLQIHACENAALASSPTEQERKDETWRACDEWGVPPERRAQLISSLEGAPALPPVKVDRVLADGDVLDVPGFDIVVMHTPGHTSGHISLRSDSRQILLTGDHLLPTMHAGVGLGGDPDSNPLTDYLNSLKEISRYPHYEVLPGHGYRFKGLAERARQSGAHHLDRSREVAAVVAEFPECSTWELAERLTWTAGWERLDSFYLYSALSQTVMHREFIDSGGLDLAEAVVSSIG
ncbi:MBL fold metallo-hydrolase [Microbacterium koreense]